MNDPVTADEFQAAVSPLVQKEQLCDEFEAAWRKGNRPQIEAFLARADSASRDKLLDGLLEIELEYRSRAGESVTVDQYRSRFPAEADRVETIFPRVVKCRRLGDYELLEELGRGGMGVVYRARHVLLNQIVAVKVLPGDFLETPTALARFRREMQSIGALDHPNIVRAYNAGEADGTHFLAMEYVDGVDLKALVVVRRVRKAGPLPLAAAIEIIRQAAIGLQYTCEKGLVHRDIKPANLMLTRSGVVKILDLGMAKLRGDFSAMDGRSDASTQAGATIGAKLGNGFGAADDRSGSFTQAGTAIGTVDYMAPEQWQDPGKADIRADIYGLGCTLYYLLTGKVVYGADTVDKKMLAHRHLPPPSLCKDRADVPPALDAIFQKMLAKNPQQRQQNPAEVIAELSQLQLPHAESAQSNATLPGAVNVAALVFRAADDAVASDTADAQRSSPQTASRSSWNWMTRRRKTAAMISAAVLLLIIAFVVIKMRSRDGTLVVEAVAVPLGGAPQLAIAPFDAGKAKEHQRAWAKYLGVPVETTNSIGLKLVIIPPGEYMMGAVPDDPHATNWERPQHRVRISKAFYLGTYTVTVGQFRQFVEAEHYKTYAERSGHGGIHTAPNHFASNSNGAGTSDWVQDPKYTWNSPPFAQTPHDPVILLTQGDAAAFCHWLAKKENRGYRLPTEAEWEYACRAGSVTVHYWGDGEAKHALYANLAEESYKKVFPEVENSLIESDGYAYTAPVGSFRPNAFGLYDMVGNVCQKCSDAFSEDYYAQSPTKDPTGPEPNSWFVVRGCGFDHAGFAARSSLRWRNTASWAFTDNGFRVVMDIAANQGDLSTSPRLESRMTAADGR